MSQWIEFIRQFQDGQPTTRAIKIDGMSTKVVFTDRGYAEVSNDAADLLVSNNPVIEAVTEPASPGTYYSNPSDNDTIELTLPDGAFTDIYAETGDIDVLNTEELSATQGGAARLDMVGARHSVPSGESVTIPEGFSEVVVGPYDLDGELTVNGRMEIF